MFWPETYFNANLDLPIRMIGAGLGEEGGGRGGVICEGIGGLEIYEGQRYIYVCPRLGCRAVKLCSTNGISTVYGNYSHHVLL